MDDVSDPNDANFCHLRDSASGSVRDLDRPSLANGEPRHERVQRNPRRGAIDKVSESSYSYGGPVQKVSHRERREATNNIHLQW